MASLISDVESSDALTQKEGASLRFANAWVVVSAQRNTELREALNSPGWTVPDGAAVASLLTIMFGGTSRVRGIDFFTAALESRVLGSKSHFLVAPSNEARSKIISKLASKEPQINICGSWVPPIDEDLQAMCIEAHERVRGAGADIVWVGIGTPKQDVLCEHLAKRSKVLAIGIGAAMNFYAGLVPESPKIMRALGLEWLFRLSREPRRLWRRYLVGNIKYLILAIGELVRHWRK